MRPPSSGGSGKRFSTARFRLINTENVSSPAAVYPN